MECIRLLLLDEHVLFRESLSRLLALEADLQIVAECGTLAEGLEVVRRMPVDVVLLDWDLGTDPRHEFLSAARESGYRGKTLIVAGKMDPVDSLKALRLGASGIFQRHNSVNLLLTAIRLVAGGEAWIDQAVIHLLADGVLAHEGRGLSAQLTERERRVLRGVLEGHTNKKIAGQIGATEGAVKASLQQLFRKAGVRTRSQLVRVALGGSSGAAGN